MRIKFADSNGDGVSGVAVTNGTDTETTDTSGEVELSGGSFTIDASNATGTIAETSIKDFAVTAFSR